MKSMIFAIIKKYFKLLLSLSLTASLGFALIAGLSSSYQSLDDTCSHYVEDYAYPDAIISTEVTSISDADKLRNIDGVTAVDTRLCGDSIMKTSDGEYLAARILSYSDDENQQFYYWEKADSGEEDSVLLEFHYAESHDIHAGDTVSFRIRDEYRSFLVEGVVSRPETLYTKISDRAWGINYDFGYVYASIDLLAKEYEKDYQSAKGEIDENAGELAEEIDSANELLNEKETELANAKQLLEEQKNKFLEGKEEAAAAKSLLTATQKELTDSLNELKEKQGELEAANLEAEGTKQQLLEQKAALQQAKEGLRTIDEKTAEIKQQQAALNQVRSSGVLELLNQLPPGTSLQLVIDGANAITSILAEAEKYGFHVDYSVTLPVLAAQMDAYFKSLEGDPLMQDLYQWSQSPQIQTFLSLMYSADPSLSVGELIGMLNNFAAQIEAYAGKPASELTIGDLRSLIDQASADAEAALNQLSAQRADIVAQLSANGISENEIDSTLAALDQGIEECDRILVQIKEAGEELTLASFQIRSGLSEISNTLSQIEQQLADAQSAIDDAETQIREGEDELNRKTSDALREFANLEAELDKAYKELDENEGYDHLCNQFLLYLDEDADGEEVLRKAEEALADDPHVTSSYTYEGSPVKKRIDKNLNPIHALTVYCPIVFYLVTLGIIFLFMSMIIKQSRREIGILRALGFSRGRIRAMYCIVSVFVALAGLLIGCGIAYGLIRYVGSYFADFFPLPFFVYEIDAGKTILGAVATIAVCLAATLITTGSISKIMPKEAMSRPVQEKYRIPEWASRLTKNAKPINKFSLTSLLRNKGRFIFASVCVAVTIMLIFGAISFIASKNYVIHQTFNERILYDSQIFLEDVPDQELIDELNALEYVSDAQKLLYYESEVYSSKGSKMGVINAIEPDTQLIGIQDMSGNPVSVKEGEIILEKHLAQDLSVTTGDTVYINGTALTVSAVSDQCANWASYVSLKDAEKLGSPDLGCIICDLPKDQNQALITYLIDNETEGYLYTIFMPAFFNYNLELYNTYDTAAWILILFAVIIGFVIILNTAMTNLQEVKRELCVLRSIGFQNSEISRSRFTQTILQFLIACPFGLAGGILFAKGMLPQIGSLEEEYAFASGFKEYAIALGVVFAYLIISHFLAMRSTKKWDISESIKEKE